VFSGTDLANCQSAMASDIKTCQSKGKLVTLSLGGGTGEVGFSSDSQAETFATQVWNLFLGGSSSTRPFGNVVLDGYAVLLSPCTLLLTMYDKALIWTSRAALLHIMLHSLTRSNRLQRLPAKSEVHTFIFDTYSLTFCQLLLYSRPSVSLS
jgi:hypothetical protein